MASTKPWLSGFRMVSDPRGVQLSVRTSLGLPGTFPLSSGPGLPGFRRRGWETFKNSLVAIGMWGCI